MATAEELVRYALRELPFEPLDRQMALLTAATHFAVNGGDRDIFVLNGYAGTGKTSMVGALIKALVRARMGVDVLAPTGRAAKVAASFSGFPASTIHRRIFRPVATENGTGYLLGRNERRDTLFIVDEASLISDSGNTDLNLMAMLVRYVYSAVGCKIMLVGDEAQLPPVGQTISTSMQHDRLRRLGLNPIGFTLDIPVRQAAGSGIVHNATLVRQFMQASDAGVEPRLQISGYPEIEAISSADLAERLSDSYSEVGQEQTIIITRSNWRANRFNQAVRTTVLYAEEPLACGEKVVIAKNDYYWGPRNKAGHLIANGEIAEVRWVGKTQKAYGRFFSEAELQLSDGAIINAQIMLRSLVAEGPSIPRQEMERFYNVVLSSYEGELSEKIKGAESDPFYNALQAKYAYCVTCHKAQGGQWRHVYIDMGGISPDAMEGDFFRWLYTALTRATEKVFLINPGIRLE